MSNRLNFAKTQALMQIDQANSYTARIIEQKRLEDDFAEKVRALTEEQEEYAGHIAGISTGIGALASLITFGITGSKEAASAAYGGGKVVGEWAATEFDFLGADEEGLREAEALVDDFDFTITDPEALKWGRNQVFEWESRNQDIAQQTQDDFDEWIDYYDKEWYQYGIEGIDDAKEAYKLYEGLEDLTKNTKFDISNFKGIGK